MKIDCMVGVFFYIIDCCANILKSIFQVMGIAICTISLYISSKEKKQLFQPWCLMINLNFIHFCELQKFPICFYAACFDENSYRGDNLFHMYNVFHPSIIHVPNSTLVAVSVYRHPFQNSQLTVSLLGWTNVWHRGKRL